MADLNQLWGSLTNALGMNPVLNVRAPAGLPAQQYVPLDSPLNFEQRILRPTQYPTLPQDNGNFATHKMMWDGGDGNYMAFPSVVQKPDGKLYELSPNDAYDYAMKTGEYRKFGKQADAENYAAGGYKQQWGAGEPSLLDSLMSFGKAKK
jgi:hypothetical protein